MADIETIPDAVTARDSQDQLRTLFFPEPAPLADWAQDDDKFQLILIVRILDSNPKSFNIHVKRVVLVDPIKQSDLRLTHVAMALSAPHQPGGTNGLDLNLKLNSRVAALAIFEMYDPAAEFLEIQTTSGMANGIVRRKNGTDLIHQAQWIEGSRRAVSVIFAGVPDGEPSLEQEYGLGVKMRNSAGTYSDVNIDPKIGNDGED